MSESAHSQTKRNLRSNIGFSLLFGAIIFTFAYCILRTLYAWVVESENTIVMLNPMQNWFLAIHYDQFLRYVLLFTDIGIFVTSLLVFFSIQTNSEDVRQIIVIKDDICLIPSNTKVPASAPLQDFFLRTGPFRRILLILSILAFLSIVGIFVVYLIHWLIIPQFLYTDIAKIVIDCSMLVQFAFLALRMPDLTRMLAKIGVNRQKMHQRHIHEGLIGLLWCIGGFWMILNGIGGGAYFERTFGGILLLMGAFLVGRDWKDVAVGKFIHD